MWFTAPEGSFRMSSFRAKRWKKKYSPSGEKEKEAKDQAPQGATVPANNWEFLSFAPSAYKREHSESGESTPSPPSSRSSSRPASWLAALPHQFIIEELDEELQKVAPSGEKSGGGGDKGGGGGRERRPDPVREASEEQGRTRPPPQDHEPPDPGQHGDSILQHVTKTKVPGVSRSSSYKEQMPQKRQQRDRRKTSDPNLSKTNNDVEADPQTFSFHSNSGSSSNSNSSSTRSLESPSNITEAVASIQQQPWDSDIEAELIQQDSSIPEDLRESMTEDERERQEIINELFYTERSHVRGLKVLERVFYRPMKEKDILNPEQIQLLFANLEEMVQIHSAFNNNMKALKKENPIVGDIGQLFVNMFDGPAGDNFQKAAATFCAHQHNALELLKEKRKKDQRFHNFLTEAESNSVCRRLQLKDILPTGWQRLTKYPLLLENLLKYKGKGCDTEEISRLQRALERSKEVLNFVDSAIKDAINQSRLSEIQRRLETGQFDRVVEQQIVKEFNNLDLTKHRLLHEGPLNWRIQNRQKLLDIHVLLLEDAIILLQKQDEKFVLKFYSQALSPIIKVSSVLVRPNAVDKKALFLVNTSQNEAQIYDFVANSYADKRKWFKHISDAAEAYKTKEGKNKRGDHSSTEESNDISEKNKELEDSVENDILQTTQQSSPVLNSSPQAETSPQPQPSNASPRLDGERVRNEEMLATYTEEVSLVEPSELVISQRDIHTAHRVLTPLEKLRRKDELVKQALYEKQVLVADILHVPREEFEAIADLAGEQTGEKDPSELILATVHQASSLARILNEALRVSEEDVVSATVVHGQIPSIPAHKLYPIVTSLNSHVSNLLNVMNERDEERDRLRKELQKTREQLHSLYERNEQNGFPEQENSFPESTNHPPEPSEMLVELSPAEGGESNTPGEPGAAVD